MMNDERLNGWIAEACRGDEAAMEAIFQRHSPPVFRMAASLLNDADDAEEVTQDTFVYALRNLRRYDPARSAFQTWLFTIAISRCRNKRRRKWLRTVPLSLLARNETRGAASLRTLEDWLAGRGVQRELWAAVQTLSPKLREAVALRFLAGLSYGEIGEAVGCGAKAAESRVRMGIGALRKRLAAQGAPQSDWLEAIVHSQGV
jgi:RNA polymerase sigma-70 factor (ECF subfamily)